MTNNNSTIIKVLSIAGSDCSSGAGIQADVKTIHSLGGYCLTAITSVTSQNSKKVFNIFSLPSYIISSQIDAVYNDIGFDSVKIGMLTDNLIAKKLSLFFKKRSIPVVVDPIFKATTGRILVKRKKFVECQESLYSISNLIMPNLTEAMILTNLKIRDLDDMYKVCESLSKKTNASIFLKGGELEGKIGLDLLYEKGKFTRFTYKKIGTKNTHGTGCTLSTAVAFFLGKDKSIENSIIEAKKYLLKTIKKAPMLVNNYGPLGH